MGALLTTALLVPILLVPSNATLLVDELMEDPSDRIGKRSPFVERLSTAPSISTTTA